MQVWLSKLSFQIYILLVFSFLGWQELSDGRILINQSEDIVLGSHGMLLSSGETSNKMEQQEGSTSSVPGKIRGDVRP